ncbi:MAG: 4-hydroxy-tetrahydrodipicolinate synthase [Coriobacteriales bacterium]|jgi:4-hydroxy-tetrahydrodipicolinate synthase|nr:4-hydroxy-tetrahydrodipicolinate synthase [Coriobacteriales bacterium]
MSEPIFGRFIPAMITPFDAELALDLDRAEQLADKLIGSGSDALVISGSTGEAPTLTQQEKLDLFSACVSASAKRVPIIANVGSNCTADSVEFAKKAAALGVDGLLTVVPYYNKPTQEGIYRHFSAIAASVDIPIILYNIPGRSVVNMDSDTTIKLANDCDNIIAIKEASGRFDQILEIIEGAPRDFSVYSGNDDQTLAMMKLGGTGVVSTAGNVAPERMKEIVELAAAGKWNEAEKAHEALDPLMTGLFVVSNPILVKAAMKLIGFDCGGLRLPLTDATSEQINELELAMKQAGI